MSQQNYDQVNASDTLNDQKWNWVFKFTINKTESIIAKNGVLYLCVRWISKKAKLCESFAAMHYLGKSKKSMIKKSEDHMWLLRVRLWTIKTLSGQ